MTKTTTVLDKKGRQNRALELLILFVVIPVSLALEIHAGFKLLGVLVGVVYVVRLARKAKLFTKTNLIGKMSLRGEKAFWIKVLLYLPVSTLVGYFIYKDDLFRIVRLQPMMWLGICFFYGTISVYIQEFLYRTFFFHRYEDLLSKNSLLVINAIVFGLAHSMFHNIYVVLVTAIGGFVLAMTFYKTRSLFIACVEHAIYGCWLFTLGVGKELAFPQPEDVEAETSHQFEPSIRSQKESNLVDLGRVDFWDTKSLITEVKQEKNPNGSTGKIK